MDISKQIEKRIKEYLNSQGVEEDILIETPKDKSKGDLTTNIALKLSKKLSKTPSLIASDIQQLFRDIDDIDKVEIAGPGFVNFYLNKDLAKKIVNKITSNPNFGESDWGKGNVWVIEHTSPNPNKAMHLGHLRNNLTGMAISNISKAVGITVVMDCIDNNRGIAIAKLMWGYLKFANKDSSKNVEDVIYWYNNQQEWKTPEEDGVTPDKFMDRLYVLGSNDFKNSTAESKVRKLVVDWEAEDKFTWALWEKVLGYVYEGQKRTLKRLNSNWDYIWHEHEHYKEGKDIVEKGLKEGIFLRLDDGAVVTNLKKYNIPDTIVIKKDGTSLYITQDLALTKKKIEKFKPDKLFWVIGPEQTLAMKQVFAVSEQLGLGSYKNFNHIAYGFISIKGQGKMSSRAGNVVYIDDLLDDAKNTILDKIKNEDLSETERLEIAEKVGIAAVKYSILKVGRLTDTAFDFDVSLSFEGDSGPYILYTYARANAILKQSQVEIKEIKDLTNLYNTDEESDILRLLNKFEHVVLEAAISYSPNVIATYIFELAQSFNKFYNSHSVLKAENQELIAGRILLTKCVLSVIKKGLVLLNIDTVESM